MLKLKPITHLLTSYVLAAPYYLGLLVAIAGGMYLSYWLTLVSSLFFAQISANAIGLVVRGLSIDLAMMARWLRPFYITLTGLVAILALYEILKTKAGQPSGLLLAPGELPALTNLVQDVAKDLSVAPLDQILLLAIPAAAAHEGVYGSTILLGVPLIRVLSCSELKAVIAHEIAHFDDRAFVLHRMIWRIETAIRNTRETVKSLILGKSGEWYFLPLGLTLLIYTAVFSALFLPLTRSIRYQFELYCDQRSAAKYGSNNLTTSLQKVLLFQGIFANYWKNQPDSLSRSDCVQASVSQFLAVHGTATANQWLASIADIQDAEHPSLAVRLASISNMARQAEDRSLVPLDESQLSKIEQSLCSMFVKQ